jgi:hypothetical protein
MQAPASADPHATRNWLPRYQTLHSFLSAGGNPFYYLFSSSIHIYRPTLTLAVKFTCTTWFAVSRMVAS